MEILQVKNENDFNSAVPGEGTVLIWPEVLSDGSVILHSRTHDGQTKEVGSGFGQEIKIQTDVDITQPSESTNVVPYLKLNEDSEVEFVAKKSDGTVVQVAGGGSGFGKPSNVLADEDINDPPTGKVTPYFRNNDDGEPELVARIPSGDIISVGGSDMIPAICVGVDEENKTCSAMAVELIQQEDGTIKSVYKGKKITNLIYTWDTPDREDLALNISGHATSEANGVYNIEDEYTFENERVWINETTETYVIKYKSSEAEGTSGNWALYFQDSIISEESSSPPKENPYDSSASWTNSVVCTVAEITDVGE